MLAIIADGLRVWSSMVDITKAHPWAAPHRSVNREKTTTTLLDKRRIRVDRNKNKLSANYCAVRFAEITPVSRSAARAPSVRPPPDVRGWRHFTDNPRTTSITVTSSLPRFQWAPLQWIESRRCRCRNGRASVLWVKIWLCGGASGMRLCYKGGSRAARAQCARVSRVACAHFSVCLLRLIRRFPLIFHHAARSGHLPSAVRSHLWSHSRYFTH